MIKNGTNCLHVKIKKGEVKVFLKANSASQEYPFLHLLEITIEVAYLQNFMIGKCPVSKIYATEVFFQRRNLAAK